VVFQMLCVLRAYFKAGGRHRMIFTLPPLVVAALRTVQQMVESAGGFSFQCKRPTLAELFAFAEDLCCSLGSLVPEERLRLWLLCASVAANVAGEDSKIGVVCGAFLDNALTCLESQITDANAQLLGLQLFVGTLRRATCLGSQKYEVTAERAIQLGGKFPTQGLQSKAMCLGLGLFWGPARHEVGQTLACLRRALRCVDAAIQIAPTDVCLFIEVLDRAVYLFGDGHEEISPTFISGLLALCVQHLRFIEPRVPADALRALQATLAELHEKRRLEFQNDEDEAVSDAANVLARDARYSKIQLEVALRIP